MKDEPDLTTLARMLDAKAAEAAEQLLGEPSYRSDAQLRWGNRGSLALEISGAKCGLWHDHEGGTGGDVLALACRHHHGDMRAAIDWMRAFLKVPENRAGKPAGESKPGSSLNHRPAPEAASSESRLHLVRHLWGEAVPIAGTIAETYLRDARGIRLPTWPTDLRFHPACPRGADRLPAMLAAMRDPLSGEAAGLHRTYLRDDGSDRLREDSGEGKGKMMLGGAGTVMLSPFADITHGLHIGEGVETALSALALGLAPAWAAASAGAIARFPVLPGIGCLTILADADGAGMRAAETCAARWREAGHEARILAPVQSGQDVNDVLRKVAA